MSASRGFHLLVEGGEDCRLGRGLQPQLAAAAVIHGAGAHAGVEVEGRVRRAEAGEGAPDGGVERGDEGGGFGDSLPLHLLACLSPAQRPVARHFAGEEAEELLAADGGVRLVLEVLHPAASHGEVGLQGEHDAAVGGEIVDGARGDAGGLRGVAHGGEAAADGDAGFCGAHPAISHGGGGFPEELEDVRLLHAGHEEGALPELGRDEGPLRAAHGERSEGLGAQVNGGGKHEGNYELRITSYELGRMRACARSCEAIAEGVGKSCVVIS